MSETVTDVDGNYTLDNLEPGDYTMSLEKAGYMPYTEDVTIVEGDNVNADIILTRFAKMIGKVIDTQGTGIEGVKVIVTKK